MPEASIKTTYFSVTRQPEIQYWVPPSVADFALVDAKFSAGAGGVSVSYWHDKVASGEAPQPVIREHRCTRWLLADVRGYWVARSQRSDTQAGKAVTARAAKASAAAAVQRRAQAAKQGAV